MTFEVTSIVAEGSSLHPHILTKVDIQQERPDETCHLDVIYILPPSVFVDPYQLKDKEGTLGKATLFGEHDLELPLERVKEKRGSVLFLRQQQQPSSSSFVIDLPMHLRYQKATLNKDRQPITITAPFAGWTCGHMKFPPLLSNPLVPTLYNSDESLFYPLTYNHNESLALSVPVGKLEASNMIQVGTFGVVLLCTTWIFIAIYKSIQTNKRSEAKGKRRKSE